MSAPRSFLGLLCAAALLAAGCGGDDEEAGAPGTAPETVTVTQPAPPADEDGEPDLGGTDTAPPAGPRDCGDVAFEPDTDAGAFGIEASGATCAAAREVAATSEGADGLTYEARGFSCSGTPGGGELPTVEWTCTREGAEVSFSTS